MCEQYCLIEKFFDIDRCHMQPQQISREGSDFKWIFCHVLVIYQISTYKSFYTISFHFSHFCDFHTPPVFQNNHIPTTNQYFSLIQSRLSNWEKIIHVFSIWIVFFLTILVMFLGFLKAYVWRNAKYIKSKTHRYNIYMVIKGLIIHTVYLQNFVFGLSWSECAQ